MIEKNKPKNFLEMIRIRSLVAEFTGTAILVFSICMVVSGLDNGTTDLVGVALVHFLIIASLIYTFMWTSGSHFNPSVTLCFMIINRLHIVTGIFYMLAQFSGGIVGAACAYSLLPEVWLVNIREGRRMATNTVNPIFSTGQGFFAEFLVSFMMTAVMWGTAFKKGMHNYFVAWSVGATVTVGVFLIAPITRVGLNPARAFAPPLIMGSFPKDHWIFWVAPTLGCLCATLLYRFFILDQNCVMCTQEECSCGNSGTCKIAAPPKQIEVCCDKLGCDCADNEKNRFETGVEGQEGKMNRIPDHENGQ